MLHVTKFPPLYLLIMSLMKRQLWLSMGELIIKSGVYFNVDLFSNCVQDISPYLH